MNTLVHTSSLSLVNEQAVHGIGIKQALNKDQQKLNKDQQIIIPNLLP